MLEVLWTSLNTAFAQVIYRRIMQSPSYLRLGYPHLGTLDIPIDFHMAHHAAICQGTVESASRSAEASLPEKYPDWILLRRSPTTSTTSTNYRRALRVHSVQIRGPNSVSIIYFH